MYVHREMDLSTAPLKLTATNLRRSLPLSCCERHDQYVNDLNAPARNQWQQRKQQIRMWTARRNNFAKRMALYASV